jgi:hypothetical protein
MKYNPFESKVFTAYMKILMELGYQIYDNEGSHGVSFIMPNSQRFTCIHFHEDCIRIAAMEVKNLPDGEIILYPNDVPDLKIFIHYKELPASLKLLVAIAAVLGYEAKL